MRITLRGRRLFIARVVWIALTVSAVGLFVASVPAAYEHFHKPCTGPKCDFWAPSHAASRNLEELDLSLGFYAVYNVTLEVLTTLGYCAVGAFIFWRKPEEWMPLLLSLALVLFGIDTLDQLKDAHPVWSLPVAFVKYLGTLCFFVSFYLFPDGRFVPRWTRVPAAIWIAYLVPFYFFPDSPLSASQWPPVLEVLLVLALLGTLIFAQTYRYLRVSDRSERQQTK